VSELRSVTDGQFLSAEVKRLIIRMAFPLAHQKNLMEFEDAPHKR